MSGDRYKWVALSNTTIGVLMANVDGSIVIISLPAIFRGIGLDPLAPGNIGYLLWMVLGYLLVSAVARGGMQFMLIIWLQGIWLPLRGFAYSETPLWPASTCFR